MKAKDTFYQAITIIKSNKLRSGITITIIALGITALIGIITAIQAMNQKMTESFSTMGANGFSIRFKERNFRLGNNRQMVVKRKDSRKSKVSNLGKPITIYEAETFARQFRYANTSIACSGGGNNSVYRGSKKTNPTVTVFGSDEQYVDLNGFSILGGRNLSRQEVENGSNHCLLGYDVAKKLFPAHPAGAVNQVILINNVPARVIGVLNSRGSTFGFSRDNIAIVSYKHLVRNFLYGSFTIAVKTASLGRVEETMGEAEGLFRNIRQLAVTEESNFALERSNSLAEKAMKSLNYLTAAVTIIGLITLIGAAIGLMNIMLVAVAERTKEIGLAKAIGAKKKSIRQQFLSESLLISLGGAIIGVGVGILLGNLFSILLQTGFVVPWNWIFYGIIICTVVGLTAGLYPAIKAGNLNPIEALRYE